MNSTKATLYFDGLCLACSSEINHYKKQQGADKFNFVDITAATFDAVLHGLDPFKVHKVMHFKDENGKLFEGVAAFQQIWSRLPRYNWLAKFSNHGVVRFFLELGYKFFVIVRPYLPRRKADCSASPYCELPK